MSRGRAANHVYTNHVLGTYSHVAPELQQEAADRMGRVLWRSTGTPSQDCCHLIMEAAARFLIMLLTCGDLVEVVHRYSKHSDHWERLRRLRLRLASQVSDQGKR
jgi:hypothetical protein